MAIHPVFAEIFPSGPKWWTNQQTLPSSLAASVAKNSVSFCSIVKVFCIALNEFCLISPTSDAAEKTNGTAGTVEGGGMPST